MKKLPKCVISQLKEDLNNLPYYERPRKWEKILHDINSEGYKLHYKTRESFENIVYANN